MKIIPILVILFIVFSFSQESNGQQNLTIAVPLDTEIKTGKLENGLTYFIRKNKEPEKRVSFYFIFA